MYHTQYQRKYTSDRMQAETESKKMFSAKSMEVEGELEQQEIKPAISESRQEFTKKYAESPKNTASLDDFKIIEKIGKGMFGKVLLVKHTVYKTFHAMKVMNKKMLSDKNTLHYAVSEKRILHSVSHPFIVHLDYSFHDDLNLYVVLEFAVGADFYEFHTRNRTKPFDEDHARFYTSQLVLALQYLHNLNIIHRDVKPENVLVFGDGYTKLADFGHAKLLGEGKRASSQCGTLSYSAPEMFLGSSYSYGVDLWSLGCMLYEMVNVTQPFHEPRWAEKILSRNHYVHRSLSHICDELNDLLRKLFVLDPSERIDVNDMRRHSWFDKMDWDLLLRKELKAPFIPGCAAGSTIYFKQVKESL